ncbi:MAG TPA: thermonuclease family protein [Gallionella sp.]
MRTGLLLVLLACTAVAAYAGQFTGKVIAVFDGDTVLVARSNGPPVKVRLAEIDAPEKAQQGGMASRKSLSELVLHKQVSVNSQATDSYGRLVAHLAVDDKSVNEEQIRHGMAWEYSNYHSNKTYIALQSEAQQARRGLWAQSNPTPPWEWRKQHPGRGTARRAPAPDPGCGNKKYCSEMASCEEAGHYLTRCGIKTLDGDGDGIPCEQLCAPQKKQDPKPGRMD